ncbi:MAG: hypothetical protein LBF84_01935 [Holosporales bacterium]|jgi:hypothetical protein|nr:hypothetical protein [Holosporales bacterium]
MNILLKKSSTIMLFGTIATISVNGSGGASSPREQGPAVVEAMKREKLFPMKAAHEAQDYLRDSTLNPVPDQPTGAPNLSLHPYNVHRRAARAAADFGHSTLNPTYPVFDEPDVRSVVVKLDSCATSCQQMAGNLDGIPATTAKTYAVACRTISQLNALFRHDPELQSIGFRLAEKAKEFVQKQNERAAGIE